jgi:selenocysteine lyase/cysteine desulfurase
MTVLYLNAAGTSWPKPAPVHQASHPIPPDRWPAAFADAHAAIAAALHVPPTHFLPTPGCTSAIRVWLAQRRWQPGTRVLVSGMEHDALSRPILALRDQGVEVVVLPRAPDGPLDTDALAYQLDRGGVALVALSLVANVTGERLPVEAVVRRCRAAGARVLVDGAQATGWWPLDLAALGADAFVFAGHKGPQAPTGVGGLVVSDPDELPDYCDTGSVDLLALRGLAAGLAWMGAEPRHAAARAVEQVFRAGIASHVAVFPNPPDGAPTTAFRPRRGTPGALARRLRTAGIVLSGGHQCAELTHRTLGTWPDGVCRASFGPLITEEQARVAAGVVVSALQAG